MRIGEYLSQDRPAWDWVTLDCCRWVDSWVVLQGHASPMAGIGVEYDSERSALRRIAEGGGLAALWSAGMSAVGIEPAELGQLRPGDVAVIQRATSCGTNEAAAIWTGERWATLGLRGLDFGPAETLAVWHV